MNSNPKMAKTDNTTEIDAGIRNRRRMMANRAKWTLHALTVALVAFLPMNVSSCTSRPPTSSKPRPPRPEWNPAEKLEFTQKNCTADYAELYCYNGRCFMQMDVRGVDEPHCNCTPNYYGRRCEYRGLDNLMLPSIDAGQMQTAAISASVCIVVLLAVFAALGAYVFQQRRRAAQKDEAARMEEAEEEDEEETETVGSQSPKRPRHEPIRIGAERHRTIPFATQASVCSVHSPSSVMAVSPSGLRPFAPRSPAQIEMARNSNISNARHFNFFPSAAQLNSHHHYETLSRSRLNADSSENDRPTGSASNRSRSDTNITPLARNSDLNSGAKNPMARKDTQLGQLDVYWDAE